MEKDERYMQMEGSGELPPPNPFLEMDVQQFMENIHGGDEQMSNTFRIMQAGTDAIIEAMDKKGHEPRETERMLIYQIVQQYVKFIKENKEAINGWLNEFRELEPYIRKEIEKPEYKGITLNGLMDTIPEGESSLWSRVIDRAQQEREKVLSLAILPSVNPIRASKIEYPFDKLDSKMWTLLEQDAGKELKIAAEKRGSKKQLDIIYSINFEELDEGMTITKRLTSFDKRVYIAISALFNAGNNVITLTQIYYAMGYTGKPGKKDKERINYSITKMTGARIYVNNKEEADEYKYDKFIYDGSLLPIERGSVVSKGKLSEAAIHLFREPPIISFAKSRNQITTLDVKLLQSPISKTDANLRLEDYLITRIARAKSGRGQRRILYKTIYEKIDLELETPDNQKNIKKRLSNKIKAYLDYYVTCKYISRYTMEQDGITVYF